MSLFLHFSKSKQDGDTEQTFCRGIYSSRNICEKFSLKNMSWNLPLRMGWCNLSCTTTSNSSFPNTLVGLIFANYFSFKMFKVQLLVFGLLSFTKFTKFVPAEISTLGRRMLNQLKIKN